MSAEEIRQVTQADGHLKALTMYMKNGWPLLGTEVKEEIQPYWLLQDDAVVMNWVVMKDRRILLPASLQ